MTSSHLVLQFIYLFRILIKYIGWKLFYIFQPKICLKYTILYLFKILYFIMLFFSIYFLKKHKWIVGAIYLIIC